MALQFDIVAEIMALVVRATALLAEIEGFRRREVELERLLEQQQAQAEQQRQEWREELARVRKRCDNAERQLQGLKEEEDAWQRLLEAERGAKPLGGATFDRRMQTKEMQRGLRELRPEFGHHKAE